ncbi:MAG: PAS domain S-box protein [Planctomycetaceae bacterium]
MRCVIYFLLLPLSVCSFPDEAFGLDPRIGDPLVDPLRTNLNGGRLPTTDLAVTDDGILFAATVLGVAVFDGERWDLIRHPQRQAAQSLAAGSDGQIYVCFTGDFGVLKTDLSGAFTFQSLQHLGSVDATQTGKCQRVLAVGDRICAAYGNGVMICDLQSSQVRATWFPAPEFISSCSIVRDEILVGIGRGYRWLRDGEFVPLLNVDDSVEIPGYNNGYLIGACEYEDDGVLIVAYQGGLSIAEDGQIRQLNGQISVECMERGGKGIARISRDLYLLTTESGILFFDQNGNVIDRILPEQNSQLGVCMTAGVMDSAGQIWIPTIGAVPVVKVDSRLRSRGFHLNHRRVTWVRQFGGRIYAAVGKQVVSSEPGESRLSSTAVDVGHSASAVIAGDRMLVSTMRGLMIVGKDGSSEFIEPQIYLAEGIYDSESGYVVFGSYEDGVQMYRCDSNDCEYIGRIENTQNQCLQPVVNESTGTVWFTVQPGSGSEILMRFDRKQLFGPDWKNARTDVHPEWVMAPGNTLAVWKGVTLLNSEEGLQQFDSDHECFVPFSELLGQNPELADERFVDICADENGCLWLLKDAGEILRVDRDGRLLRYQALRTPDIGHFLLPGVSGNEILVRTAENEVIQSFPDPDYSSHALSTRISGVTVQRPDEAAFSRILKPQQITSRYPTGPIEINYTAGAVGMMPVLRYQYRMVGLSEDWSPWTSESRQQFQSIAPGSYRFEVRARGCDGRLTDPATVSLRILSPWYNTALAWTGYGLASLALIIGAVRSRISAVRRQVVRLEEMVEERTSDLQHSRERYRWLVEGMEDHYIFFSATVDGRFTYVSPSVSHVLGYSPDELIGTSWIRLLAGHEQPPTAEHALESARRLLNRHPSSEVLVLAVRHQDGSLRQLECALLPFRNQTVVPETRDCIARDITELYRVRQELQQSRDELEHRVVERTAQLKETELQYRSIVEDQNEMIIRFDRTGRITFSNEAFARAQHSSVEEVIGRSCFSRIHPDDQQMARRRLATITDRNPGSISQVRVVDDDGSIIWQEWNGRGIFDADGTFLTFQAVGRDITALKEAELRLQEKEQQLTHLNRVSALGEMVAGISHEINQPLATIANFSSALKLLSTADDSSEVREKTGYWASRILTQTERITGIIQRLRRFSRPGAQRETFLIGDAIREALLVTEVRTRTAVDDLQVNCPADLPRVHADQIQIEQVLVNLVRNACDSMESLPRGNNRNLTISVERSDPFLKIMVTDSGPGIPEDVAVNLFDPFVTTRQEGMGIGLAISRSIIENHGGTIRADTHADFGCFEFTLPIEQLLDDAQ